MSIIVKRFQNTNAATRQQAKETKKQNNRTDWSLEPNKQTNQPMLQQNRTHKLLCPYCVARVHYTATTNWL